MSLEILTRLHKQVFMSSQLPNKSFNYQTDWTRELELAGPGPAHLYQKQWNMFYPSRDKSVTSSCASQTRGILTIKCSSFSLLVAYSFLLAFARNDLSPAFSTKYPCWRLLACVWPAQLATYYYGWVYWLGSGGTALLGTEQPNQQPINTISVDSHQNLNDLWLWFQFPLTGTFLFFIWGAILWTIVHYCYMTGGPIISKQWMCVYEVYFYTAS